MLRYLFLLLIFAITVHALSDSEILKRADSLVKKENKSDQFRAYNDYKNLYLRALMSDDDNLKRRSLRGIVKTGDKLRIDVSEYSKKLSKLKKIKTHKPQKNEIKKDKKIKVISSHKLKSATWKNGKLVLKFNKKLSSKQINYFTLYDKKRSKYKYIFDIHASMSNANKTLRKKGVSRIKLAQYNSKTIRLVIENSSKLKVNFKKDITELIIKIVPSSKQKSKKSTLSSVSRKNKTIVIDAGHGGKDPGAVGYRKYREKIVVFQIAKRLKTILKDRGYKVYMTRNSDKFIKLSNRTKYANKKNADIFISIHANAISGKHAKKVHGIECYFLSPSRSKKAERIAALENSADMSDMNRYGKNTFLNFLNHHKILASNKLAIDLQRGMLGALRKKYKNVHDGGVREGPFWVLVGAQMPAVLVEVGFITHPTEARRLVNKEYQKRLATGLAFGIDRYFANNR